MLTKADRTLPSRGRTITNVAVFAAVIILCIGHAGVYVEACQDNNDTTCSIKLPGETSLPCNTSHDCKDFRHSSQRDDVSSGRARPFPALISKLGLGVVNVPAEDYYYDGFDCYTFIMDIRVNAEDIEEKMLTGLMIDFKRPSDVKSVCTWFQFTPQPTPRHPTNYEDQSHPSGDLTSLPNMFRRTVGQRSMANAKVSISNYSFGNDVFNGHSYVVQLRPNPDYGLVEYRIRWEYLTGQTHPSGVWTMSVVMGVAKVPGTNQIHLVVSIQTEAEKISTIYLDLRHATGSVKEVKISPTETSYMFSPTVAGRYRVVISPIGMMCSLTNNCPVTTTDEVLVDTIFTDGSSKTTPEYADYEKAKNSNDVTLLSAFVTTASVTAGFLSLVALSIWLVKRMWDRKTLTDGILVVSLEDGLLKEEAVKHFAWSLGENLNLEADTLFVLKPDLAKTGEVDQSKNQHHNTSVGDNGSDLERTKKHLSFFIEEENIHKMRQYNVVLLVGFLRQGCQSDSFHEPESERMPNCEDSLARVLTFTPKNVRRKMCVVYFTESSNQNMSSVYSSSGKSSGMDSDFDDMVTVLISKRLRNLDKSGKCNNKHTSNSSSKFASMLNIRQREFQRRNDCSVGSKKTVCKIPCFWLPLEITELYKWLEARCNVIGGRCKKGGRKKSGEFRSMLSNYHSSWNLESINANENWRAVLTCAQKAFIDEDNRLIRPLGDEMLTIADDLSASDLYSCCYTIETEGIPSNTNGLLSVSRGSLDKLSNAKERFTTPTIVTIDTSVQNKHLSQPSMDDANLSDIITIVSNQNYNNDVMSFRPQPHRDLELQLGQDRVGAVAVVGHDMDVSSPGGDGFGSSYISPPPSLAEVEELVRETLLDNVFLRRHSTGGGRNDLANSRKDIRQLVFHLFGDRRDSCE